MVQSSSVDPFTPGVIAAVAIIAVGIVLAAIIGAVYAYNSGLTANKYSSGLPTQENENILSNETRPTEEVAEFASSNPMYDEANM